MDWSDSAQRREAEALSHRQNERRRQGLPPETGGPILLFSFVGYVILANISAFTYVVSDICCAIFSLGSSNRSFVAFVIFTALMIGGTYQDHKRANLRQEHLRVAALYKLRKEIGASLETLTFEEFRDLCIERIPDHSFVDLWSAKVLFREYHGYDP
jgi:hypothetical protein